MPRLLNDLYGIVLLIKDNHMEIALPMGGTIEAPRKNGISLGDLVAFMTDTLNRRVIDVMLKKDADLIVKRGSDPILSASLQEPPKEENYDDYRESIDPKVLWCPGL